MTVNIDNGNIFELVSEFCCSDGHVAVVDSEEHLIGIFGNREYQKLIKDITHGLELDKVQIADRINYNFNKLIYTERLEEDIKDFFDNSKHHYIPVVFSDGRFYQFIERSDLQNDDRKLLQRRQIAKRWKTYDKLEDTLDSKLKCLLCGETIDCNQAQQKVSMCIFYGGRLTRYVCPHCGGIIGPRKMLHLSAKELDEEYRQHYFIFQEGDTTEDEIYTFQQLHPQKEKKYLNYGCGGAWSIQELRNMGFDVYGYEPYANESHDPWIITERAQLATMKFDGIFSNNLLEHLTEPVKELKFMASLLSEKGIMAHATPCYEYLYEYTRFHLCFPVGKASKIMFEQAGLQIIEKIERQFHGDRYLCCVLKKGGNNV